MACRDKKLESPLAILTRIPFMQVHLCMLSPEGGPDWPINYSLQVWSSDSSPSMKCPASLQHHLAIIKLLISSRFNVTVILMPQIRLQANMRRGDGRNWIVIRSEVACLFLYTFQEGKALDGCREFGPGCAHWWRDNCVLERCYQKLLTVHNSHCAQVTDVHTTVKIHLERTRDCDGKGSMRPSIHYPKMQSLKVANRRPALKQRMSNNICLQHCCGMGLCRSMAVFLSGLLLMMECTTLRLHILVS